MIHRLGRMTVRATRATVLALAAAFSASTVLAQYPERPVRIINPYGPGGSGDTIQRLMAQRLSQRTGKTFIVELKPGASGRITYDYVAKSAADGYTLAALDPGYSILPALYSKLSWNPAEDLIPITMFARTPHAVVAGAQSKFGSVSEIVAYARAHPGKVTFGHSGAGTTGFVLMQQLMREAQIRLTDVPYKNGADALAAVLSGSIDLMVTGAPTVIPFLNEGRVRVVGLTSEQRWPGMDSVPTLAEQGFNVVNYLWFGLMAPKGVSPAVIDYLYTQSAAVLDEPGVKQALLAQAAQPVGMPPQELQRLMRMNATNWAQLLQDAGIKAE